MFKKKPTAWQPCLPTILKSLQANKNPQIKNLSPLRSSDRRKIADQIIADFGVEVPQAPAPKDDEEASEAPANVPPTLSSIRSSLLPENTQSARFTTTHGPALKELSGTVYVGAHPGEDERILWIKVWDRLYPTVYTLWHNPRLVPLLYTPSFVMQKLQGGADLMTPGLARGPPFPPRATKNAIVAVARLDAPSVPLFVGVCEIDVAGLEKVEGVKGHAVRGMHWEGDELWSWSSAAKPGVPAPTYLDGWDNREGEVEDGVRDLDLEDDEDGPGEGGVSLNGHETKKDIQAGQVDADPEPDDHEPTTAEIDEAFKNALIYSLYDAKQHKEPPHYGIEFPILPTLLISHHVQPYLPMQAAKHASSYHIKKTSWKNVKKFIKYLDKEIIVKSKDRNGGETVIQDVDFNHRAINSFTPYPLPKKDTSGNGGVGGPKSQSTSSDPSINQTLELKLLYRPSQKLAQILPPSASDSPYGSNLFDASSLRETLESYLTTNALISSSKPRIAQLDPVLSNSVFSTSNADDKPILAAGSIHRDGLFNRIISDSHLCSPFHVLLSPSQDAGSVKAVSGPLPKVLITLETRSGNKTVTKVSGVEKFNINPQLLADELQKKCASSVSVTALVGAAAKGGKLPQEILIQGSQRTPVEEALERRGVKQVGRGKGGSGAGNWVEVVDKTKGKGKGRR
jgi:translation initiation factor 2D